MLKAKSQKRILIIFRTELKNGLIPLWTSVYMHTTVCKHSPQCHQIKAIFCKGEAMCEHHLEMLLFICGPKSIYNRQRQQIKLFRDHMNLVGLP